MEFQNLAVTCLAWKQENKKSMNSAIHTFFKSLRISAFHIILRVIALC